MVKGSLSWGTNPPRPLAENLIWAGLGILQSRKKYHVSSHLNPDNMTWMEIWVELGWELSHERALCPLSQLK